MFINLLCFFSAFYPNGIDSLPSDSCHFLGFKTQVKVFSMIPRIHISAAKVNENFNPCCSGRMVVKLSCEFSRSGSSHSYTVRQRRGEVRICSGRCCSNRELQQGVRGRVPAEMSHAGALQPQSCPVQEPSPAAELLPQAQPCCSSRTTSSAVTSSHPPAQHGPGLCQAEEELLTHPSPSLPKAL